MAEDEPFADLERQVAELEAELQRKRAALEARVTGSGASAAGIGTTAGGADSLVVSGVVGRDVTKVDVHAGGVLKLGDSAGGSQASILRREYLFGLLAREGRVELAGLDRAFEHSEGRDCARVESIYTSLRVQGGPTERSEMEGESRDKRPSALAMVDRHSKLVLLGAPGSGKSTFLRFLAVCLAGQLVDHPDVNIDLLRQPLPDAQGKVDLTKGTRQPWSAPVLLPVVVVLRHFAYSGLPDIGQPATADHLWRHLETKVPEGYLPFLRNELGKKGGFLLFDGLDEVPQAERRRAQLLEAIEAFMAALPLCRAVVTCRSYAYEKKKWQLPGFAVSELVSFDDGQIRRFVRVWYEDAVHRGALPRAELLLGAIFRNPKIRELARRPLLLTLMASLHAFGQRELPERRDELYEDAVELLLYGWEKRRRDETRTGGAEWQRSLSEWLETSRSAIRGVLESLAFEAHLRQPQPEGEADISLADLSVSLFALCTKTERNPLELIEYLQDRAGLLLPQGGDLFRFPHRSFQEYLAACHLARRQDFPETLAELTRKDPDRWREVALLAGATASAKSAIPLWALVDSLCPNEYDPQASAEDAWGAHIAAQAVVERGLPEDLPKPHRDRVKRLRAWLVELLTSPHLPARERALAGRNLAVLGDPREGVTTLDGMEFCWVPSGPFWMGSPKDDPKRFDDEPLQEELNLPHGYWMACFPVTGAQWREYVAASGAEIGNQNSLGIAANEPASRLSWDEAEAFCRWLTERWHRVGFLPAKWAARLPSEEEWEKAARGGLQVPVEAQVGSLGALVLEPQLRLKPNPEERRSYPWEGPADAERANYGETQIGRPSAVGAFPAGKSPYGCEELSGNVWEWTQSVDKLGNESLRVLRGGSCFDLTWFVRCSYRLRYNPLGRSGGVGFRVMLSPFFSEL